MKDYNLFQAASIAIIGGADGPTSIYVSQKSGVWIFVLAAILTFVVLVLLILALVRNARKANKGKIILYSVLIGVFAFLMYAAFMIYEIFFMFEISRLQNIAKKLHSENYSWSDDSISAFPFEGESLVDLTDFAVVVDDDWAGRGFLFKMIDEDCFKVTKEIFGSGVPITAEESYLAVLSGNVLGLDNGECFVLEDGGLRYFSTDKEMPITGIYDAEIWFEDIKTDMEEMFGE